MLQQIREKAQGWIAWIIIGILSITFALWGIENYSNNNANQHEIAAKVNGVPITHRSVENKHAVSKEQALEQLIVSQVLMQAAAQDGYRLSPKLLGQAVISIPYFQKDGEFSNEQYERVLYRMGYTRASFLAELGQSILLSQIKFGITQSSFVLPHEPKMQESNMQELEYNLYIKSKINKAKIIKLAT